MSSPFRRVAPQVVEHADGWRVQIGDRYHVEYVDGPAVTSVAADLDGPVIRLHPDDDINTTTLERIVSGLRAMGEEVVVE